MGDCLWAFINGVCNCDKCGNCEEYLSANSEKGGKLLEKYQEDVEEALQPVYAKWRKQKEDTDNGGNR